MTDSNKAVFLSYASQDAEAAGRICASLRAAGIEVWFDQSELRGGDVWDQAIHRQIRDCALFVPVISAHTQARSRAISGANGNWRWRARTTWRMKSAFSCRWSSTARASRTPPCPNCFEPCNGRVCQAGKHRLLSASGLQAFWAGLNLRRNPRQWPRQRLSPFHAGALIAGLLQPRWRR